MPYKFTPSQWIIFDYKNGETAIGYTRYKDSKPIIIFTSDAGETGTMPYGEVVRPRRLYIESRELNNIRKAVGALPEVLIDFKKGDA